MAWVTYDLIHESRKQRSSSLRIAPVERYLESLGFVPKETGSSHTHWFPPDSVGMWTITSHGGHSHLSPRELENLDDVLSEYFARDAEAERAKVNALNREQTVQTFPDWFTGDYLRSHGLRLSGGHKEKENGDITIVLVDRDYPELSARITFDPHHKPLKQEDVEGTIKKMKAIKVGYLQALDSLIKPYEALVHVDRITRDGKAMYELRDAETGDYISEVKIPNMAEEDPHTRDRLMNYMLEDISDKLVMVEYGVEHSQEAERAAKAESRRKIKRDERKIQEGRQLAKERELTKRRNEFDAMPARLDAMGFDVQQGERDGVKGLIVTQRDDFMTPLRDLDKLLQTVDRERPEVRTYFGNVKTKVKANHSLLGIEETVRKNPVIPYEALHTGQLFIPLTMEDGRTPTPESMKALRQFIMPREQMMNVQTWPKEFVHFKDVQGTPYANVMSGRYHPVTEGASDIVRGRELSIISFRQAVDQVTFASLKDDLGDVGMRLSQKNPNMMLITKGAQKLDVPCDSQVDIRCSSADQNAALIKGIEKIVALRIKEVLGDGDASMIPAYDPQTHNLKDILGQLDAIEHTCVMAEPRAKLDAALKGMQEYGYSTSNSRDPNLWAPPHGLGKLKKLPVREPSNVKEAGVRLQHAGDILSACERHYTAQEGWLDAVRGQYGDASIRIVDGGLHITVEGCEPLSLRYAFGRNENPSSVAKPLLDDESFYALKKFVQSNIEQGAPERKVDGSTRVERTGMVNPSASLQK